MKNILSRLLLIFGAQCSPYPELYSDIPEMFEPPYVGNLPEFYKKLYRDPLLDKRETIYKFKPRKTL